MTTDLRIGILGLGSIGTTHARALRNIPGVRVTAFSGGSTTTMAECGWPEATQTTPDGILSRGDVDAVAVCTPSETHAALTLGAAAAGKHAVVEKPIALSTADADRLVRAQDDHGVVIAMVAQRRFEPEVVAVKRMLAEGVLGELRLATTHVHWLRDDAYYAASPWRSRMPAGGSLMNQGVHNIDLLQWLCGTVTDVTAQYGTLGHDMSAEDTTVATVRFESGALGVISTSTATPPGSPATLSLHTSRGVVEIGQGEITRWEFPELPRPEAAGTAASGAADPAAIGLHGHIATWEDVVAAVREGRRSAVDAVEAARTMRLLCAVYAAAESGRRVSTEHAP